MPRGTRFALAGIATVLACGGADDRRAPAPGDQPGSATVLYKDRVVEVARTLADPNDLSGSPEDLPRINDFILKPEGACSRNSASRFARIATARCSSCAAPAGSTPPAWRGACNRSSWSIASMGSGASATSPCRATPSCNRRWRQISRCRTATARWSAWPISGARRSSSSPGPPGEAAAMTCPGGRLVYEELKDKNFEIIAVAQDTGGKAAAEECTPRRSRPTPRSSTRRTVTERSNLVNVPSGASGSTKKGTCSASTRAPTRASGRSDRRRQTICRWCATGRRTARRAPISGRRRR